MSSINSLNLGLKSLGSLESKGSQTNSLKGHEKASNMKDELKKPEKSTASSTNQSEDQARELETLLTKYSVIVAEKSRLEKELQNSIIRNGYLEETIKLNDQSNKELVEKLKRDIERLKDREETALYNQEVQTSLASRYKNMHQESEQKIKQLETQVEELSNFRDSAVETEVENLKNIGELDQKIHSLQEEILKEYRNGEKLTKNAESLKRRNKELENNLNTLQDQLSEIQEGAWKSEVEDLRKIEVLKQNNLKLQEEIRGLHQNGKKKADEVVNLEKNNKKLSEEIESLKEELADLKDSVESYENKIFSQKEENGDLDDKCLDLQSEVTKLQKKLSETKKQNELEKKKKEELLQDKLLKLKSKLKTELEKNSQMEKNVEAMKDKLKKSKDSVKVLKEGNLAKDKEIKSLNTTISLLQDQLAQKETKANESTMSTDNESSIDLLNETLSEILESGESMVQTSFSQEKLTFENKIKLLEQHAVEFRRVITNKNTELEKKETAMLARIKNLEDALDLSVRKYKKVKRLLKESLEKADKLSIELKRTKGELEAIEAIMKDTNF